MVATCEQCHAPDRFVGDVVKVFYDYADDEANTQTKTVATLKVGGRDLAAAARAPASTGT